MSENIKKSQENYLLLRDWLELRNSNLSLCSFFEKRGWLKVILYGGGDLAQLFLEEIAGSKISCVRVYDKNADNIFLGVPVEKYSGQLIHDADVVLVSVFYDFDNIKKMINELNDIPVVSIRQVVNDVQEIPEDMVNYQL